ncbi:class I SAM-dependent methyltransferase [Alkalicoccus luteus]|uniref:Class I SAM-dependent methyltransferase n=1 Tax=Alkalicoccus luteus TaxID=1237094 RepID=A0A969TYC3_9BACI|nr:methyltransferase domain-containing protein [Alkalicoccus luteus]NJP39054.1 class I SAM-dependent methyltransferase [Alkalicoccus luteus]
MEKNVFEEVARRYDTEERKQLAAVIAERVKLELFDSTDKALLDYGGGTGLVSLELTDLVQQLTIADASEQMLKLAQAKIAERKLSNATVLYADFVQEDPGVSADIVLISLVLLHIPDTEGILQAIAHVLRETGRLIIVDFNENERVHHPALHSGFDQKKLEQILQKAGFSAIQFETFYEGEGIFMKQDASMFICTCEKAVPA